MKKLIFILCLGLCLNGAVAEVSVAPDMKPVAQQTEESVTAGPDADEDFAAEESREADENVTAQPAEADADEQPAGPTVSGETSPEAGTEEQSGENPGDAPADGENGESADPDGEQAPPEGETDPDGEANPDGETTEEGDAQDGEAADSEETGIPDNAQAWIMRDDAPVSGSLSEIVAMLSGDETVYIRSRSTLHVEGVSLYRLAGVRFKPDAELFGDAFTVRVYTEDPENAEAPEPADFSGVGEGDTGDIYVRVEAREADPDAEDAPEVECQIEVEPASFPAGVWQSTQPVFKLSGLPEEENWSYAVLIYNERFIPLPADTYMLENEGIYSMRFVIQDRLGDIRSITPVIRGWFDWTGPTAVISPATDEDYAVDITASDATSGVQAISVDSGSTWVEVDNRETYRYSARKQQTLKAGMIRVRDKAGNVFKSTTDVVLAKVPGAAGNGNSKKTVALPHSSEDAESAAPYATKLIIPEGTMRRLSIDGKAMELTLMADRTASGGDRSPAGFSGTLTRWMGGDVTDDTLEPDTLILEADIDPDRVNAEWHFNGAVYRELADCGVSYLGFKVGNDLCVVPTEGFTGGSKYTELKMMGISTRKFDYTLTMKLNSDPGHMSAMTENDFSEDCDLALAVQVENMSYELSGSTRSPMYYYDVYLGPEEMLDYPFGAFGD